MSGLMTASSRASTEAACGVQLPRQAYTTSIISRLTRWIRIRFLPVETEPSPTLKVPTEPLHGRLHLGLGTFSHLPLIRAIPRPSTPEFSAVKPEERFIRGSTAETTGFPRTEDCQKPRFLL